MKRSIVLTGGIASGKTVACERLEELGARIIDADIISREILKRGGRVHDAVLSSFSECKKADGELDRVMLKELIFKDDSRRQCLNSIMHPVIFEEISLCLEEFKNDISPIVVAIPLYFEGQYRLSNSKVLNIETEDGIRIERLILRDNISRVLAKRILECQASNSLRKEMSDITITNNGTITDFFLKLEKAFYELSKP